MPMLSSLLSSGSYLATSAPFALTAAIGPVSTEATQLQILHAILDLTAQVRRLADRLGGGDAMAAPLLGNIGNRQVSDTVERASAVPAGAALSAEGALAPLATAPVAAAPSPEGAPAAVPAALGTAVTVAVGSSLTGAAVADPLPAATIRACLARIPNVGDLHQTARKC
jgi:hypothetical protein